MIARVGVKWTAAACIVPAVASIHSSAAFSVAVALPLLVAVFFRDPEREPDGPGVVSPADGKVSVVREENGRLRVGVFMNLHDVHVNRVPVGGTVSSVVHHDGAHRPAFSKDSDRNERAETRLDGFTVVQIAGAFARRVTTYVDEDDTVKRGERLGVIAFGSRADVVFPESYTREDLHVEEGDRVRAGETVLAPRI
ncbi:MAG: protein sorting system archaetidylserine decarboxylase [Halobacteriales archaeon]